jgi:hypothetical protein
MSARQHAYRYRVERNPTARRNQWRLSVVAADGRPQRIGAYMTRAAAVSTARILAGFAGSVEVRA